MTGIIGNWFEKFIGRRPRVHLYSMTWNESAMIGYFFRHYDPIVDRYTQSPFPGSSVSFFALGGDSLSSIRLVATARRHGLVFTPQQVFDGRANGGVVQRHAAEFDELLRLVATIGISGSQKR